MLSVSARTNPAYRLGNPPMKKNHSPALKAFILLSATAWMTAPASHASALWGVVPGRVLAKAGSVEISQDKTTNALPSWTINFAPSTVKSPEGGTYLNTSESGQGIFFGTIGNSVLITRKAEGEGGGTWRLGALKTGDYNNKLKADGGIRPGKAWLEESWSYRAEKDGDGGTRQVPVKGANVWQFTAAEADQRPYSYGAENNFAPLPTAGNESPSYMLAQNSVVVKVWACVPSYRQGYYPMYAGGTGARWHANPEPVINAVGSYGENPVEWSMTGWWQGGVEVNQANGAPVVKGESYNNVTLVDAMALWPCEMMADFYLPGGAMSLQSIANSDNVVVRWDTQHSCVDGAPPTPPVFPSPSPWIKPSPSPSPVEKQRDKGAVFYWNAQSAPGKVFDIVENEAELIKGAYSTYGGSSHGGSVYRNFDAVLAQMRATGLDQIEAALRSQGASYYQTSRNYATVESGRWTTTWDVAYSEHTVYRFQRTTVNYTHYWERDSWAVGNAIVMIDPDLGGKPVLLSTKEWGTIMAAIRNAEAAAVAADKELDAARAGAKASDEVLRGALAALTNQQKALDNAQAASDRAWDKALGDLDKLEDARQNLADRENALLLAKRIYGENSDEAKAAAGELAKAKAKADAADLAARGSKDAAAKADKGVEAAQKSVDAANVALAGAVEKEALAQAIVDKAQEKFDRAKIEADNPTVTLGGQTAALSQEAKEKGVAEAQAAVDKAQAAFDTAAKAADAMQVKFDEGAKQVALAAEASKLATESADGAVAVAQADLKAALDAHAAAMTAQDSAQAALTAATSAKTQTAADLTAANESYKTASGNLETAQAAYDKAVSDYGKDSKEATAAAKQLSDAQATRDAADRKLIAAESAASKASGDLKTAQAAADSAVKVLSETKTTRDAKLVVAENAALGAKGALEKLAALVDKQVALEQELVKLVETAMAADAGLSGAMSNLAEQKFWAANATGSYTTTIAGVLGAKTATDVSYYQTGSTSVWESNWKIHSPVTISFDGKGDFLAGSDNWRPEASRIPKLSAMRAVDLDGQGKKMWEWIGPTEGLLVWNPKGSSEFQPTGEDFFGNCTWGKKWSDGYKPLAALDKNGDAELSGDELRGIWVWRDVNLDAVVQNGELVPLRTAGIQKLSLKTVTDERGGIWVEQGATTEKGTFPTRDWWSAGGMSFKDYDGLVDLVRKTPSVWIWEPNKPTGEGEGGGLSFYASKEYGMVALSVPAKDPMAIKFAKLLGSPNPEKVTANMLFNVKTAGNGRFLWRADLGDAELVTTVETKDKNTVDGTTRISSRGKEPSQSGGTWTGRKVSGPGLVEIADVAGVSPTYNR